MPPDILDAMDEICTVAQRQNTRVWIDAEQQVYQNTLDAWTVELMRRYNKNGHALVYNTLQAYLKHTPDNVLKHLKLAQTEDWSLGIKLVRGAYIAHERRDVIHDTIEDTHRAYNTIVKNLLEQSFPGVAKDKPYPRVQLFLATHNEESVKKAIQVQRDLVLASKPTIRIEFGQLQGMADEVSCSLLQLCDKNQSKIDESAFRPSAFKCLAWGTTQECLQFLLRRLTENKGAMDRTRYWVIGFRKELWRRLRGSNFR
jgi:proline dehydrogenase